MSSWAGLRGRSKRRTGVSGTETFAVGCSILQIHAIPGGGGGTVQIVDDANVVTLPAGSGWWGWQAATHKNFQIMGTGSQLTIVFTGTAGYFIEYLDPAGKN